ncbi:molybdenum cofactor guanylyltransferase [Novosphingobium sp. YJ-S2-02]|uniref:Molybdenum cofactor guanylyltransferase n=1 Tax=Novosphingobium aureum TaxID=2792964 RepID=A0A931MM88_9SPHN|nr:molybdenum cofactor guanylyltransferase [Novosphingobium aureum]MBH0114204.1 molybdenum cofactor guanylyltransferase [Novosphingobium aureum]
MILGAVLAGGQSQRFGSDKALAEIGGRTLLSRAVDSLAGWCDHVLVIGRESGPAPTVPDWPHAGMGPLAGLAAALRYAQDQGYAQVLTIPVDAVGLPEDLPGLLSPGPACLDGQPVIGLWPVEVTGRLETLLRSSERHSMKHFAELANVRLVAGGQGIGNINRPEDLAGYASDT